MKKEKFDYLTLHIFVMLLIGTAMCGLGGFGVFSIINRTGEDILEAGVFSNMYAAVFGMIFMLLLRAAYDYVSLRKQHG